MLTLPSVDFFLAAQRSEKEEAVFAGVYYKEVWFGRHLQLIEDLAKSEFYLGRQWVCRRDRACHRPFQQVSESVSMMTELAPYFRNLVLGSR